ncbi:hydrogenase/urease nickel incorporation protein HypA [Malaciobacter canalis]|jgi:hydrogenase nickel incorporation protein HypA/HybF|uniref:Hydrogenase maturation factor HypA n=2 Tax=Malaciobacter TaxID=2321114 RepID=A0AB36ZZJ4_9BACT|nr:MULTISPECIES: hydrogenase/urease nickel incorporation protein HypA [Malaciobacter]PHO10157.1 hydrogenase/urease nickel incorporation protein HypA [Malaciobacter canalis]PPK62143.1 hydrogenase-3 nickel incorporation protein HypA [Malaciobacter marinus]QEE32647.1 hydrogenase nickel insertion protein HypA [Malaciobacter canalis]SKB28502.1 Hydrogenase-3 nickel incorporation protein HypA [Malaciobacter marinus]
MHEYSIVQSLLDQCEEHAKANNATKVKKIVIKIGILSGVEVDLLETAFETFKEKTICDEALFVVNRQNIVVECKDCNETSTLEKHEFLCPLCNSGNLNVIDGEDMYLMSLELE